MSDDMSKPAVAPDTAAIDANNEIVDRLVAGFETPLYRFLRHHRGKAHLLAFLLAVVWATPRFPQVLLGLPLIAVGLGIRAWASGYLAKNIGICAAGPYVYCRHPMYLATFIIIAGIAVAGNNFYMSLVAVALTVVTYVISIRREEALLRHLHGEDYTRYCRVIPCLFPRLTSDPEFRDPRPFAWKLAMHNRIHEQVGGVLLLLVIFAAKAIVLAHYGYVYPLTYGLWPRPWG